MVQSQRSSLFKQMKDEQVVSALFDSVVASSEESLGSEIKTFSEYFKEYSASDDSTGSVRLNLTTTDGLQPLKL